MNKVMRKTLSILLLAALLFTSADFSVFAANASGKTSIERVWKEIEEVECNAGMEK